MAKKASDDGVNKSQAITDYMAAHPEAGPKEIRAGLAAQGIEVSQSLIGAVKYRKAGGKKQGRGRPRAAAQGGGAPGRVTSRAAGSLTANDLLEAKKLVDQLGGIEAARRALETLEQLR